MARERGIGTTAGMRRPARGDRTYERLVAVKDRLGPANVFAGNQNIRPS